MIIRITRLLLLLQLAIICAIAWSVAHLLHVHPLSAILWATAVVAALRLGIVTNNFLLSWRYRSPTPPERRLNFFQGCRLLLEEFLASMTASSWTMPFHSFSRRLVTHPTSAPVLLIHGYGCNSGYWHSMSKCLLRANISHYAVNMEPVLGDIDDYVPLIAREVEKICKESGTENIIMLSHSMGGLAARAYLRRHGIGRIAAAITLGTPHHGTVLARFGTGLNSRQMRHKLPNEEAYGSDWLHELGAGENAATRARIISLYSHHDNIIAPQTSSYLPGAKNIAFYGIGHVALASHPQVQRVVVDEIRRVAQ